MSNSFGLRKTVKAALPSIPFEKMATGVLGEKYELSLVICGDDLARRMNIKYRKKKYVPNVLSFPIDKNTGEIFLNVRKAEREARQYKTSVRARFALLYVHGLFHLKGLDHGTRMEEEESRILRKFGLYI